jgi:hypothetical protein
MTNWNGTILGPPHVRNIHTYDERSPLPLFSSLTTGDMTERPREPHLLAQNPLRPPIPRLPSRRDFHQQSQPPLRQREQWQSKQETMKNPTKSPQDKAGRTNRRTGEVLNRSSERLIENILHKERKDRMKDTQLTRFFPRTGRPL